MLLLVINSNDLLLFLILEKATEKLTCRGKSHRLCPLHPVETTVWLCRIELLLKHLLLLLLLNCLLFLATCGIWCNMLPFDCLLRLLGHAYGGPAALADNREGRQGEYLTSLFVSSIVVWVRVGDNWIARHGETRDWWLYLRRLVGDHPCACSLNNLSALARYKVCLVVQVVAWGASCWKWTVIGDSFQGRLILVYVLHARFIIEVDLIFDLLFFSRVLRLGMVLKR